MNRIPAEAYRERIETMRRISSRLKNRHTVLGGVKMALILGGLIAMYRVAAAQSPGCVFAALHRYRHNP